MQRIIEKASVLIEAMPYFRKFQGEAVVVKFGGSIMDDESCVESILKDVAFMSCVGLRPVLVHGGGKAISAALKKANIPSEFREGLRVTPEEAMQVVEQVLNYEINPPLVQELIKNDCKARSIHGDDIMTAKRLSRMDEDGVAEMDWGFVGEVTHVDVEPIQAFLAVGITPVVTPLGRGADKKPYNINADSAAVAIAAALQARKLVFLSDVPGLLGDPEDSSSLFSSVKISEVEGLIKRGVIRGGMLPKINGCVDALRAGVRKIHIIDAEVKHSLLLELFTDLGVGTEIVV
ncbi:MAG: acetylglutamate kinase [Kiritimatiellae bacterium]|nr:acetylglutamate kinase [Kiritimatiellia bacterium]